MTMKLLLIASALFFSYVGYNYVKVGLSKYSSKEGLNLKYRRSYVKKHMDVFGVCNNGKSLDDRSDIYVLTLEELGLRGSDNARR